MQSDLFGSIEKYLNDEWKAGKEIFPPKNLIFEAFNQTAFDQVKVVLLGQDPYHDNGQVCDASQVHRTTMICLGSWFILFRPKKHHGVTTVIEKYF